MKKFCICLIILIAGSNVITSCKKVEGPGGKATIEGNVYYKLYDPNDNYLETEEARDEDVYITYGDNDIYDDNMNTHSDGSYRFDYLRTGDYTIFAYSDCNSCPSQTEAVEVNVTISDKKEIVTAPDIEIKKIIDLNDGTSTIKGKVIDGASVGLPDERVYIVYDDDDSYFDDMRTNPDGSYEFRNLIIGSYMVFAYTSSTSPPGTAAVEVSAEITSKDQQVQISDIVITP